ncbi:hypothetical protein [Pilimelia columellifera]|uniref:NERD domain-containing protein n=1 Tax=Pilimelia columellifera subsp. columellifera TaxID=706583 RepID=A0ABP6ALI3_9ACTN
MTGIPSQRSGEQAMAPLPLVQGARPSPIDWIRRRRAEREARRAEAAGNRAATLLDDIGPGWHVVDWPLPDDPDGAPRVASRDQAGFLVVGPGGVYAVTVVDHGRSTVLVAGDVVQVNGRRPPYVTQARRDARHASRALSAVVRHEVPVIPILAFVGTGRISTHGLPRGCLLTSYRELERLLLAGGDRISPNTAAKLAHVAKDPGTWINPPYRSPDHDRSDRQDRADPATHPTPR